jgi:anti-sigma factor RsiW
MNEEPPPGSCERTFLLLSLSADGSATPSQSAEIDAHLPRCETCRRAAAVDLAVRRRLVERADAPAPAWLPGFTGRTVRLAQGEAREARTQNRLLWMSAAAALVVAVTVQFVTPSRDASSLASQDTASVRESTRLALIRPPHLRGAPEGK